MNLRKSIILVATYVSITLSLGQVPPNLKPDAGHFSDGVYVNSYFRLAYTLGGGWYLNEDLMKGRISRFSGNYLLLAADRHTGKPMRERVLLVADDASQYKPRLSPVEYVTKMGKALIQHPGMELVRNSYQVEHAGKTFARMDYKESYGSGSVSRAFAATEVNGYLLSWTFVANSPQELNELVDSLDRLSFKAAAKQ